MRQNWIGVASAEHVRHGRTAGIMQLCHGKATAVRRVQPGDIIAYYSPTVTFGGKDKCQAFTALGIVRTGEAYPFDMGGGFCPFRRDVEWLDTSEAPIAPLLEVLDFTAGRRNWGYQLRFGIFTVNDHDIELIAKAMGVESLARAAA